jgi:hypothetical protein
MWRNTICILYQTKLRGGGARCSVEVKAQCYKLEGRGFENDFLSVYLILPAILTPGICPASNRIQ